MKVVKACDVSEFCDLVVDSYYDEAEKYSDPIDFEGVNIVAKYDVIIDILNNLLASSPFALYGALVYDPEYNRYDREFCLTINSDEQIWIEPAWNEDGGRYLYTGEGLTYVHEDCNSDYLKVNKSAMLIEFDLDKEEGNKSRECTCNNEHHMAVKIHKDKDGDMNGFTQTFTSDDGYISRSFYTDNKDILKKVLARWT